MRSLIAAKLFQIFSNFSAAGKHRLSHFQYSFALVKGREQRHFRDGVALFAQQLAPFLRFPIGHALIADMNGGEEFGFAVGAYGEDEFVAWTEFTASAP